MLRVGSTASFSPRRPSSRLPYDTSSFAPRHFRLSARESCGVTVRCTGHACVRTRGRRFHPRGEFVGRNSQPLFDLGALRDSFWDGRLETDRSNRVRMSTGDHLNPDMEAVFEFGALSAQGMIPVTVREEMRGFGLDDLGRLRDDDFAGIWAALMKRLGGFPEYRSLFEAAYPGTEFDRMTFAHASNAMAAFQIAKLTFPSTPWDRFLLGEDAALTDVQQEGAREFVRQGCTGCHSGAAFTDGRYHNILMPQIGPGKGDGPDVRDDFGRARVTGLAADRYAFRTPPLRGVELTGPWGHAGQYTSLHGMIEHHGDPERGLLEFDVNQLEPALRPTLIDNVAGVLATRSPLLSQQPLDSKVTEQIYQYFRSLF